MRIGTTFLLGAANVALAAFLGSLWLAPDGGLRAVRWTPPAAVRPDLGTPSAGPGGVADADASRFMAILDRPLFTSGRRPAPVVAKDTPPPPPDPLDSVQVHGVFSGPEGGGVVAKVEGKSRRIRVSESIGGWNLKEVRGREVVFTRGGETRVVQLSKRTATAGGGTPAVQAASGTSPARDHAEALSRSLYGPRQQAPATPPKPGEVPPALLHAEKMRENLLKQSKQAEALPPARPAASAAAPAGKPSGFMIGGSKK